MAASLEPLQVTIVHTDGCGHTPSTKDLVEQVAAELAVAIETVMVLVNTQEEAERFRLQGSPTVLVNGLDVDPAVRGSTDFGFT